MDNTRAVSKAQHGSFAPQGSSSFCPPPPVPAPSGHFNGTPPHSRLDTPYPHPAALNNGFGHQGAWSHYGGAENLSLPPPTSGNPYHDPSHPHDNVNQGHRGNPPAPVHPSAYTGPPQPDFRRLPPISFVTAATAAAPSGDVLPGFSSSSLLPDWASASRYSPRRTPNKALLSPGPSLSV